MFDVKKMGKRIRELRGNISQDKCADALGISRGALSFYENGDRKPDAEIIFKMADYFNVSSDYLIGLSDYKTTDTNLQAACKYTGLSEKAILQLQEYYTTNLNTLNSIIEDNSFYNLLTELNEFAETKRRIDNTPKSYCISLPDPFAERTPEEEAERDAQILLEDCGYTVLTSDYEILDFHRQRIASLLINILGE